MKYTILNEGKSNVVALLGIFAGISMCILCLLAAVYILKERDRRASVALSQSTTEYSSYGTEETEGSTGEQQPITDLDTEYADETGEAADLEREYVIDDDFYLGSITDDIFSRINGYSYNEKAPVKREQLRYVHILHMGVDGLVHEGELIVNKSIAIDVLDIFYELYKIGYVLESVVLVDEYGADDNVSMAVNNSSAFNARKVADTQVWSNHAYGLAIDINPLYNPYVGEGDNVMPATARQYVDRNLEFDMKLDAGDECCRIFIEHGFTWGGDWENVKDYMHFEKQPDSVLN